MSGQSITSQTNPRQQKSTRAKAERLTFRPCRASPEQVEQVAAGSEQVADQDFLDDIRWIRSYVLAETDGTLGSI
jgi:hypothetical protein